MEGRGYYRTYSDYRPAMGVIWRLYLDGCRLYITRRPAIGRLGASYGGGVDFLEELPGDRRCGGMEGELDRPLGVLRPLGV